MVFDAPMKHPKAGRSLTTERRLYQRRRLVYYLRAWDKDNSEMLGHIVDLTSHGLMLISEEPIKIGGEYSLEVRLPDACGMIRPINLKAVCRWSDSSSDRSFFDAGFELVKEGSDEIDALGTLTHGYGFGV